MSEQHQYDELYNYDELYRRLYGLFENVTPLKKDCGALCGKACCRGGDDLGMLLLPGETTALPVKEKDGRRFVLCGGECQREDRPLACRIFPLFPAISADGTVRAVPDARGFAVCPLARRFGSVRFDPDFICAVEEAGRLLAEDPACSAFMEEITGEIGEIEVLRGILADSR